MGKLLEARKKLKNHWHIKDNIEAKISDIEDKIASQINYTYRAQIQETLGHITGDDGAVNHNGIWKAKNDVIQSEENKKNSSIYER